MAEPTPRKANPSEIVQGILAYHPLGDWVEIRIPKANKYGHTSHGYFNDYEKAAKWAAGMSDRGNVSGIYITLNEIDPSVAGRACNRMVEKAINATTDKEITSLEWLPIDIDAIRPAGISSTDEEHEAAISKTIEIKEWLIARGWPENAFIRADSGNGGHLTAKIELPPEDKGLIERCLKALDKEHSDEKSKVDTTTTNPARIWKLPGTAVRKGDNMPDRPHRMARILERPETIETVPRELIEALAAMHEPEQTQRAPHGTGQANGHFDAVKYAEAHSATVRKISTKGVWTVYELDQCPFDPSHNRGEAIISVHQNGAKAFRCHHDSCQGKDWQALRELWEGRKPFPKSLTDLQAIDIDFEKLTEGGNASRLERIHGNDMRFNHTHKKWFVWDGGRWKVDGDGGAARLAEDVVSALYLKASMTADTKIRDETVSFARSTDSRRGINNMLALAANRQRFALTADDFDKDPWLLGAGGVTVDLRSCDVVEPRRSDFITMQAGARYDSFADCPLWEDFTWRIFAGNKDLINYIKRSMGYCLTGSTSEQIFFFCYGTGANGKSVFLAVLRALMGEYAKQADFSSFLIQRNEKVRNDLASLAGARVITATEADEGGRLSMQVLKSWTGGDPITARFLFGENFTFKPQGKIWLAANTKPAITERNYAAWRRVHLIPFNVTIPPKERDQNLESKLIAELPGIFNWALEGLRDYLKVGLMTPEAVTKATKEYQQENDSIELFIVECCEVDKLKTCKNSDLYGQYLNFCKMSGLNPLSQTKFSPEMNSRTGISSKRSKFGIDWKGIDLKPEWKGVGLEPNPTSQAIDLNGVGLPPNVERNPNSSLREGLCAFGTHPTLNQPIDNDVGLDSTLHQSDKEGDLPDSGDGEERGTGDNSANISTDASKSEDHGFQRFKAGMKKRTCCLCGRSFPYPLTPYFNKDKTGYICATCHMEGPPAEPVKADSQTRLEAGA